MAFTCFLYNSVTRSTILFLFLLLCVFVENASDVDDRELRFESQHSNSFKSLNEVVRWEWEWRPYNYHLRSEQRANQHVVKWRKKNCYVLGPLKHVKLIALIVLAKFFVILRQFITYLCNRRDHLCRFIAVDFIFVCMVYTLCLFSFLQQCSRCWRYFPFITH